MTVPTKLYLAAVAAILLIAILASLWSSHRIAKLENETAAAKIDAEKSETTGRELEQRAVEYKQKIDYLEDSLSALRLIASQQDEELEALKNNTGDARHNVGRARAVQRIESTTAELCTKLAELGHPCQNRER